MVYRYYDNKNELTGAVRDLAAKKLNASDTDKIEFGEYTWNSGYCETCSYEEHEFTLLVNGEEVYDSRSEGTYGSPFAMFQEWLTTP